MLEYVLAVFFLAGLACQFGEKSFCFSEAVSYALVQDTGVVNHIAGRS
jgi:hypothetical protein